MVQLVAHEENGSPILREIAHLSQAFLLKCGIAHCEHFVHKQDLRFQMSSDSKGQAQIHAAGKVLYRRSNELLHLGKRHNLIKLTIDLLLFHAQDSAIQVDILSSSQFRVEPDAYFQQGTHSAIDFSHAFRRPSDTGKNF